MPEEADRTIENQKVFPTNGRQSIPPRVWLFFISIFVNLCGSALAGLSPFLGIHWLVLGSTAVWAFWFFLIFVIAIPATDNKLHNCIQWLKPVSKTLLIIIGVFAAVEVVGIAIIYIGSSSGRESSLAKSVMHSFDGGDSMALVQQAAQNLLDSKNPYTSSNVITALNASPAAFDKITPLNTGSFFDSFPYPTPDQLRSVWDKAIKNPQQVPGEIESRYSYPSGSFLLMTPFLALGIKDIRIVYLLLILPVLGFVAWRIKPGLRLYFILCAVLSVEVWTGVGSGETSLLYFPFLLLSWVLIRRNLWVSALCMGVAIATKQTAWFFLPFYIILILRMQGIEKALAMAAIVTGIFAICNLPFAVMDQKAWLASMIIPMNGGMFPAGVGSVSLVTSGLVHITSPAIFAAMEALVFVGALVWYCRNCNKYPNTALVLALLPLFFAWRSVWYYFYYADIVLFASVLLDLTTETIRTPQELLPA